MKTGLTVAALVLVLASSFGAATSSPGRNGLIAYSFGETGICATTEAGARPIRLTNSHSVYPAWSPDGRALAFAYYYSGGDYSNVTWRAVGGAAGPKIEAGANYSLTPSWSPDGTRIAFLSTYGLSAFHIADAKTGVLVGSFGGAFAQIHTAGRPAWSPGGADIAFGTNRPPAGLYLVRPDGSDMRQVLDRGEEPAWSPDAKRLAFVHRGDVWTVARDGGDVRRVTKTNAGERWPAWSPDGRLIAFERASGRQSDIWIVDPATGRERNLTRTALVAERTPAWQRHPSTTLPVGRRPCLIAGTRGDDVLHGTTSNNVIDGRGGNDRIVAGKGDDVIIGGAGRDRVDAGAGEDNIYARDGAPDVVDGGPGGDSVRADRFDVVVSASRY